MVRAASRGQGLLLSASLSPRRLLSDGNDRASHVPGEPAVPMPCSSTPAGSSAPGLFGATTRPPLEPRRRLPRSQFRGSITRPGHSLSTLRRMDCSTTTQDSLPAAGQALPDGIGYPLGSSERFPSCPIPSTSRPPFPSFRGARFVWKSTFFSHRFRPSRARARRKRRFHPHPNNLTGDRWMDDPGAIIQKRVR